MKPANDSWTIVTGAAGGIGKAVTRWLLRDGHRVLALDIDIANLRDLDCRRLSLERVDLRDEARVRAIIARAGTEAGIKALVCCAAVYPAMPIEQLDDVRWDQVFDTNVTGSVIACQACIPFMRGIENASIVAFSSVMARSGGVNSCHYAATKGAILGLVRSLALDLAQDGIRVNAVSPGLTDTDQPRRNMNEQQLAARAARIPLGRIGAPDDSAETVRFLLSTDASFITGQDIRVTGGSTLI